MSYMCLNPGVELEYIPLNWKSISGEKIPSPYTTSTESTVCPVPSPIPYRHTNRVRPNKKPTTTSL